MRKAILLSVLFALPIMASAFNGKAKVGGIWYNIVTKAEKAEVTKPDVGNYSGIVKIPSTIVYEGVTCKVTAIGQGAFVWGSMTSVVIPNSVTEIGSLAFRWCEKLQSVTIPESVEKIGNGAFDGCYALKTIKLPQNLETIEDGLFEGCYQLQSIIIPDNVKKIGSRAFKGCRGLKSAKIGEKVEGLGDKAFLECKELQEIVLPNSVVKIGLGAFEDCKRLLTVTLGSSVEDIGFGAFSGCGDLKDFYLNGGRLPSNTNNTPIFQNAEVEYATLHVAESLIDDCKQVKPWKEFGKVVVNPNAKIEDVISATDETIYELKDCQGQFPSPFMKKYELEKWLEEQVQYPEDAKGKGVYGSVAVDFVVEADGSISNVKAETYKPELVAEAERVVKSMPKWKAGKVNGKYARVRERIAVHFNKQNE